MSETPLQAIVGRLSREPEIRYSREGVAKTTIHFSTPICPTCNHAQVTSIWTEGDLAENIALSLSKGTEVVAVGEWGPGEGVFYASHVGPSLANTTVDVLSNASRRRAS